MLRNLFTIILMTVTGIVNANDIKAVDVHSHNVSPEFIQFLEAQDAALDETFPSPHADDTLGNNAQRLCGRLSVDADNSPVRQVAKLPMHEDGIVRLSRIEVYPEYLDEYLKMAVEVGQVSLLTEPGVLTMYALAEKENPNVITILETYASQQAYRSHIASAHFQKYKQGTLHMVKDLKLLD